MNHSLLTQLYQQNFSKEDQLPRVPLSYGTAGFRMKAGPLLNRIVFTVGLLSCIRALKVKQSVGIMITASHNPSQDNGVKIVDPNGEMLDRSFEEKAVTLANCIFSEQPEQSLIETCESLMKELNIELNQENKLLLCIHIGRDTRDSSDHLAEILKQSISVFESFNIIPVDYIYLITPQLHYAVMFSNTSEIVNEIQKHANLDFVSEKKKNATNICTKLIEKYYLTLANSYKTLTNDYNKDNKRKINIDCAYGVGGKKIKPLAKLLENELEFNIVNDLESVDLETANKHLNERCGAEYVQKQKAIPLNCETFNYLTSIDGDADRIVYYYVENNNFNLLDGDKIATLIVKFIGELLEKTGLSKELTVGVVQTAYANGASTYYLRDILTSERVFCVPTGVKYLHHKAKESDIGVYFEANGHGTVLFSDKALRLINELKQKEEGNKSINQLHALTQLINPTVGDAFSDLLIVEAILQIYGYSHKDWDTKLYKDLPSVQSKLKVKDRTIIKTSWDETTVISPEGVQKHIDEAVKKVNKGRAFIRPSGTEDVVRVYAEAETQEEAKRLALDLLHIIFNDLQGTENPPATL
ncbi:hypothetical protein ABK040_008187 [Willaertia magna]